MSNIKTVQAIYEAFGRGDVPAILERLHPEVEWEHDTHEHGIPWIIARRGRAEVMKFFESLQPLEFHRFEPQDFLEGQNKVATTIAVEATYKPTGKRIRDFEMHLFTFDDRGMVTRFRHCVDTHAHLMATRK